MPSEVEFHFKGICLAVQNWNGRAHEIVVPDKVSFQNVQTVGR